MKKYKIVEKQSEFCMELMRRLNDDVHNATVEYGSIQNHTRMEQDAVRIRREIKELYEMLYDYGYER